MGVLNRRADGFEACRCIMSHETGTGDFNTSLPVMNASCSVKLANLWRPTIGRTIIGSISARFKAEIGSMVRVPKTASKFCRTTANKS